LLYIHKNHGNIVFTRRFKGLIDQFFNSLPGVSGFKNGPDGINRDMFKQVGPEKYSFYLNLLLKTS